MFSVKYVPAWFPGAGFQKKARHWRELSVQMNTAPFEAVRQAFVSSSFFFLVAMLKLFRVPGLQNRLSPRHYWKKFLSKEIRLLDKRRSYELLDPPSMLRGQIRHVLHNCYSV